MSISEILYRYRSENLLTQKQMAKRLNISQVGYLKWENNRAKISMEHYYSIATACGIRLIDILPVEWQEKLRSEIDLPNLEDGDA